MTTNLPWKASLPFAVFFLQGPTEERWKRLRHRHSVRFPKYSRAKKRAKTYSALSFDRINFFNMANLFSLSQPCHVLLFSWANKNFLFWRLSNDCQIARPALVSGPRNWKVRTVNYGSSFFSIDLWPARFALRPNSVRNLQYGRKTRLIRGISLKNSKCCRNFPHELTCQILTNLR